MAENSTDSQEIDLMAMHQLASGKDHALSAIMERWKTRLIAYHLRFTGNESAAVDLAQETFVCLYQSRTRFRPTSSPRCFSTWLFGIAANLARNHLRWQSRHPALPLEEAGDLSSSGDPSLSAESKERTAAIQKAIAALPPDLREALILSEYEQLSHAEMAAIAGCSVKAVERRVSHAREKLRGKLKNYLM